MSTPVGAEPENEQHDPAWPDYLDALVAAPGHHTLLMENERVRVLDTYIRAGDRTLVHTHRWPATLYVLSWSDFLRFDDKGEVILDSRKVDSLKSPPNTLWSAPLPPHSLLNVGKADMHIISVELKEPAALQS